MGNIEEERLERLEMALQYELGLVTDREEYGGGDNVLETRVKTVVEESPGVVKRGHDRARPMTACERSCDDKPAHVRMASSCCAASA